MNAPPYGDENIDALKYFTDNCLHFIQAGIENSRFSHFQILKLGARINDSKNDPNAMAELQRDIISWNILYGFLQTREISFSEGQKEMLVNTEFYKILFSLKDIYPQLRNDSPTLLSTAESFLKTGELDPNVLATLAGNSGRIRDVLGITDK